jgi:uncharacterized protein YjdB
VFVARKIQLQILGMVVLAALAGGCSSNSSSSDSHVAPIITQQPVSAAVTMGQPATFSVSATSGSTLSYQWRKNATNISGATRNSYTTPATAAGDNGANFDVVVANQYGSATSAMATLTVNPAATLQSIAITPPSPAVAVGKTQQFTATGTYSDNSTKDITTSVTWASSNASFATIGASTGLATGVAVGTTQITAMQGSVGSPSDALAVTAVSAVLQSIAVTPAAPSISVGAAQQFTATGTYSDSSTKNITTSVTWSSSNTGLATIGVSTGLATGVAAGTAQITAKQGSVVSPTAALTVTAMAVTLQSIAVTPAAPSISVGATQQFTATGTYSDSSTKNITTSVTWSSSNTSFATVGSTTGLATGLAAGTTQITAKQGSVISPNDALTVTVATAFATDTVTYHYDNTRSGVNAHETVLTKTNVNSASFGKLGEFAVDGQIDGQILYLNQVNIPGQGMKNVIYAATEKDSVYAFDADSINGNTSAYLWKASVVPAGESPADHGSLPCGNIAFNGVTATPVIDRGRNAIYVVAMTKDGSGNIIDRIHALDLTTGNELFGGPTVITATYPGTGGNSSGGTVTFIPEYHHDRAALLESNGVIYTAWSGLYGDCGPYSAWVISYNADTLLQAGVIDLVPDNHGGGMWMGGGGPAADSAGNVYVITGNGFGDTPGVNQSYGNSFVKLANSGPLKVEDYFTPYNTIAEDNRDTDFGSAGPLLLPDLVDANNVTQHLAIGGGKDCNMYVVSRDNMGQFNAMKNEIHQQIKICNSENHSSPVFFNGSVYVGPVGTALEAYTFTQTVLPAAPTSQTAQAIGRVIPSISANGTSDGIVWVVGQTARTMYAFDASNLATKLYDTSQAAGNRDQPAAIDGGFITPTIANGKVFFGTGSTVAVYGLLGP